MKEKILLLHGALGSEKQFTSVKALLSERFEVYTLDFEGHGKSISIQEFSIKLFTKNVLEFLERQSIESINIFGYSMGGYVALNTALKHPEKVNKVITLGTKFDWSIESAEKEVNMLNPEKIEEKVPQFADKLKQEHFPQDWKVIVEKTAKMMLGLSTHEKLTPKDFIQIAHKVTIGIGSIDKMVSMEECESVAQFLPNGRLRILEGVEHPIDKINPDILSEYIGKSFV